MSEASSNIRETRPIKALFQSPQQAIDYKLADVTEEIFLQAQIEEHLQRTKAALDRELHNDRLDQLRKEVDRLADDDWRYFSADDLLGYR